MTHGAQPAIATAGLCPTQTSQDRLHDPEHVAPPPLETEVEVTGYIKTTLFAISDSADTDFVAALVDVYPNGHTQYLTHGIIRARYRDGVDRRDLIEPGRGHRYELEMCPKSNEFLQRHRMQIVITSSDFDRYARYQNVSARLGLIGEM